MRVTQKMMVDNLVQSISRESTKLYAAETKVATGKQVNSASDDPLAMEQILADRTTLSSYGQYLANIDQAQTWVEVSNANLDAAHRVVGDAHNLALDQGTGDLDTREVMIGQLQSFNAELLDLANANFSGDYLYSGNCCDTMPFSNEVAISDVTVADIEFGLTAAASTVSVTVLDSSGQVMRNLDIPGGGSEGTNTFGWDGLDNSGNQLADGNYSFEVNGGDSTGDPVASYLSYRGDEGGREIRTGENSVIVLNNNGADIFESSLRAISELITALAANDYDADLVADLAAELDIASNEIAAEMVGLANIKSQLVMTESRLGQQTLNVEANLREIEVGDLDQAVVELQAQQTAYDVTLETAAMILDSPSLINYLD